MGQLDAGGVARLRVVVEHERLAGRQDDRVPREGADAELGALQVDQDADRALAVALDLADGRHQPAHGRVVGVAHVDAEDVGAGVEQTPDRLLVGGRRPQRGENLDPTGAAHQLLPAPGSVSCTVQLFCSPVSTSKKPLRSYPRVTQSSIPWIVNILSRVHIIALPPHTPPWS